MGGWAGLGGHHAQGPRLNAEFGKHLREEFREPFWTRWAWLCGRLGWAVGGWGGVGTVSRVADAATLETSPASLVPDFWQGSKRKRIDSRKTAEGPWAQHPNPDNKK